MSLTLPFILILIDYFFYARPLRANLKDKAGFFIPAIFLGLITLLIRIQAGDLLGDRLFQSFHNLSVAGFALIFYLNKLILPVDLSCLYPYLYTDKLFFRQTALVTFALLIILFVCLVILSKYSKKVFFGVIFFAVIILPVLQIIPSSGAMAVVFDRYLYLSSVGLLVVIRWSRWMM
jgi:hypothetical protein